MVNMKRKVIVTKDNIATQTWNEDKKCCFCDENETTQYLFFSYPCAHLLCRLSLLLSIYQHRWVFQICLETCWRALTRNLRHHLQQQHSNHHHDNIRITKHVPVFLFFFPFRLCASWMSSSILLVQRLGVIGIFVILIYLFYLKNKNKCKVWIWLSSCALFWLCGIIIMTLFLTTHKFLQVIHMSTN